MWKFRIVLALVTALAASVALWAPRASALKKPRTFSLLEVIRTPPAPLGDFTLDRAPVGGDQFTETGVLYRWAGAKSKGARVGRDRLLLTFVTGFGANFTHRATLLLVVQVYLPDGTLLIQGYANVRADGPRRFKLPVVGGTGVYDNARGYITARSLGDGTTGKTKIDFHLLP